MLKKLNTEYNRFINKLDNIKRLLKDIDSKEYSAVWDSKYVNDLPNAAFAVVEKGYKEGKGKSSRHLPHHSKNVKSAADNTSVDLPHYRNALARANQIKSVLGTESDEVLRKRAASHLEKHRKVLQKEKASFNSIELLIWEECEDMFEKNVWPLLSETVEGGDN
jgi:hypothetical protein